MRASVRYIGSMGWLLLCAGLAWGVAAGIEFVADLRLLLHEPQIDGLDARLSNLNPNDVSWLLEQNGGQWKRHGWTLGPGEQGGLRVKLPGVQLGNVKLRLWAFDPGRLYVCISDLAGPQQIPSSSLDGRVQHVPVHGPAELTVTASSELPNEQLVLDRFAAAWSSHADTLPPLWPFLIAIVVTCAGAALCATQTSDCWKRNIWLGGIGILLATFMGFESRFALFDIARSLPPDPDTVAYMSYARSLDWFSAGHGFYSGSFNEREPVHVAALNLWFRLWGDTFPALMLYTVLVSTLLVIACGVFLWGVSQKWWFGVVASWIVALSPVWVDEASRGLRLETVTLVLLTALSVWLWTRGWVGAIFLGGTIGIAALVQSPALSVMLPLVWLPYAINLWREGRGQMPLAPSHWTFSHLAVTSLFAIALYTPHLYGLYKSHGDPSWPSYGYARWNANWEFPNRFGTPGFPSAEEARANPYAGPKITYGEYLFRLHTIPQLIFGQVKGWVESTIYMSVSSTPHLKSLVFLYHASGFKAVLRNLSIWTILFFLVSLFLTAIGWADLLRYPRYWWISFLSLWGTWYAAYLYGARLVEPFRHTGHVYPLLLFCLLWGSIQVAKFLLERLTPVTHLSCARDLHKRITCHSSKGSP